jgi:hypothetical protein
MNKNIKKYLYKKNVRQFLNNKRRNIKKLRKYKKVSINKSKFNIVYEGQKKRKLM